jgi:hypothetical protein
MAFYQFSKQFSKSNEDFVKAEGRRKIFLGACPVVGEPSRMTQRRGEAESKSNSLRLIPRLRIPSAFPQACFTSVEPSLRFLMQDINMSNMREPKEFITKSLSPAKEEVF